MGCFASGEGDEEGGSGEEREDGGPALARYSSFVVWCTGASRNKPGKTPCEITEMFSGGWLELVVRKQAYNIDG